MLTISFKLKDNLQELVSRSWLESVSSSPGNTLVRRLSRPTTIKDFLEAAGIPHCEIGKVTSDGKTLPLDHLLRENREIVVQATRPSALAAPRFICDQHLGALARLLRMMGFDTAHGAEATEPEMARRSLHEKRVVLSRNRGLLKRKALRRALLVRSDCPDQQAAEVLRRFELARRVKAFSRCPRCNGEVEPVAKEKVRDSIPPRTRVWLDEYFQCADCAQLYWEGTHVAALRQRIEAIRQAALPAPPPPES